LQRGGCQIVIQTCVERETFQPGEYTVNTINIVRKVVAESQATAIGRFVIGTRNISVAKRLEIECYKLEDLKDA
jgi:hypothetical protein